MTSQDILDTTFRATYRLQLNKYFTLKDCLSVLDHLEHLGVSHLYLSPITKAVPGSLHGYDVTDYAVINPEIGTEADLEALSIELKRRHMGILLDIVPNHMAIGHPTNRWWQDVLANGPESRYWKYFDIISWKKGEVQIIYRRFFDIDSLAGVRCEDPEVFEAIHRLPLKFIEKGWVEGLRIDHIDGLQNPTEYLEKLRSCVGEKCLLIVEKILVGDERLPPVWPIDGTTGYDFLNLLNGLFVKQENHAKLLKIYQDFTGDTEAVSDAIYASKKELLIHHFPSEVNVLMQLLVSQEGLKEALIALISSFPVYRTYLPSKAPSKDQQIIEMAIKEAKKRNPHLEPSLWKKLLQALAENNSFLTRFQQLTGPAMAKGYEDTALYRYTPLTSLNEVGSDLQQFGTRIEHFHEKNSERQAHCPKTLLATTTHDTKRSEDVRARIHVLSEMPEEWESAIQRWQPYFDLPPHTLYLLFQTLIGAWQSAPPTTSYINRIVAYMLKASKEAKLETSWLNPNVVFEERLEKEVRKGLRNQDFVNDLETFVNVIKEAGIHNSLAQTVLKLTAPGVPDLYQGAEMWDFHLVDPDNRQPIDYQAIDLNHPKYALIQKLLNFRKKTPQLFTEGEYMPIKVIGPHSDQVIAYARRWQEKVCVVIVTRFTSPSNWGHTAVEFPFEKEEWTHLLSEKIIKLGRSPLPITKFNLPFVCHF